MMVKENEVNHQVAAHMGQEDTLHEEKEKTIKTIRNMTTKTIRNMTTKMIRNTTTKVGKLFYKLFTRITGSDTCTD